MRSLRVMGKVLRHSIFQCKDSKKEKHQDHVWLGCMREAWIESVGNCQSVKFVALRPGIALCRIHQAPEQNKPEVLDCTDH